MSYPSSWEAYLFIRRNRFRKKRNVWKVFIGMSFDKTTAIYSLLIGGYLFASIFIFNDYLAIFNEEFRFIEEQAALRFWLILTIVPLRYIGRSFRNPGVLFSSSEYQLGMLPYSRIKIWLYCALEQWIKQLLIYIAISIAVVLLTPIDAGLVWTYFILFWLIEIAMTVPQWKLFQMRFILKAVLFTLLMLLNVMGTLTQSTQIVSIIVFTVVLISNLVLLPRLFLNINWGRVAEVNDYVVWNMPLIAKAIKTKFKRQRRYNIFQNRASRKRPFRYTEASIHKRIWFQYFRENIEPVVKIVGILFIAIVLLNFVHDLAVLAAIAISIHVYTIALGSFFVDRFHSDIIRVLPWDVKGYQKTYRRWVFYGSIPLLIPTIIFAIVHFSWWSPLFILLVVSVFLFNYLVRMKNSAEILNKKPGQLKLRDVIAFLMLSIIILYEYNPYFSLFSIVILVVILSRKKLIFRRSI